MKIFWRIDVSTPLVSPESGSVSLYRDSWCRQEFHQLRWLEGLAGARVRNIQHWLKTSQFVAFKPISTLCNEDTSILEFPGCLWFPVLWLGNGGVILTRRWHCHSTAAHINWIWERRTHSREIHETLTPQVARIFTSLMQTYNFSCVMFTQCLLLAVNDN